jgi:tetratricopeptide (TPR) repeat protein
MQENVGIDDLEPFILSLEKLGEKKLALEALAAFAREAQHFGQYDNLSKCYFKLKDYTNAIKFGEKALATAKWNPVIYATRFNLINLYNHANYPEKALVYINCNERIIPQDTDLQFEKAYALYLLNRKTEAEEILRELLKNSKGFSEEVITKIKFNLGTYLLYRDEFQEGMKNFVFEGAKMRFWETETIFSRNQKLKNIPFWQGSPEIENLIIYAEAGIGDEIINIRFMKHLKERGTNAYWYAAWHDATWKNDRKGLLNIFINSGFPVLTDEKEVQSIPNAKWTYSMHLPIYLNLTQKDLWYGPYIKTTSKFDDKWDWLKISPHKLRVGVRWQGNPAYDHDLHRSYPLKELKKALTDLDASFYSLQKDNGLEELNDFPEIYNLDQKLDSLEDTLSVINHMDFVITSCTSIAHASAALGKLTFIFIPISAYYVWSHSTEQSPWYGDNVILLRQQKPRTWDEPMQKLRNILIEKNLLS